MEGLNPLDILIHIINFIVTFVLLYLLLYKPVSKFMHKRRESVEQALADAAATRAEADAYLAEAKAELAATGERHAGFRTKALKTQRSMQNALWIPHRTKRMHSCKKRASRCVRKSRRPSSAHIRRSSALQATLPRASSPARSR